MGYPCKMVNGRILSFYAVLLLNSWKGGLFSVFWIISFGVTLHTEYRSTVFIQYMYIFHLTLLMLFISVTWTHQTRVLWSLRCINLYHSLGIFSRRQIDDIFLIFPSKQDLTFHANCLLWRQFAWNVKSYFLGKIRKIFQNVICWKFYPEC